MTDEEESQQGTSLANENSKAHLIFETVSYAHQVYAALSSVVGNGEAADSSLNAYPHSCRWQQKCLGNGTCLLGTKAQRCVHMLFLFSWAPCVDNLSHGMLAGCCHDSFLLKPCWAKMSVWELPRRLVWLCWKDTRMSQHRAHAVPAAPWVGCSDHSHEWHCCGWMGLR